MKYLLFLLMFFGVFVSYCLSGKGCKSPCRSTPNKNVGQRMCSILERIDVTQQDKVYPPKKGERNKPPCCGITIPQCDKNTYYRTIDGSCNNLQQPLWGIPNSTYVRLLPAKYSDGVRRERKGVNGDLPNPRRLRTTLFPTGSAENLKWPIILMTWGQFVAHDMSLLKPQDVDFPCCTPCGKYINPTRHPFCLPIMIPKDDPELGTDNKEQECMNFTRTMTDQDLGCVKRNPRSPAEQINVVSSYLDLSPVYGLNKAMSDSLRTFNCGQLKTEIRNNRIFAPTETNRQLCQCNLVNENICYKTGDSRSNQNPHLAILHILFVREHNRIANELRAINPSWNDEKLFQEARRILIAAYQQIHYREWLTILLGKTNMLNNKLISNNTGFTDDYDCTVNPGILQENAQGAGRFFHTHIVGIMKYLDKFRNPTGTTLKLSDSFHRPSVIENSLNGIEQLTMCLMTQAVEETDHKFVDDITNKLFACGKKFGLDLRAADIQRDRDHGLAYYNDYRKYCGLKEAMSFDDYQDTITPDRIAMLKNLYTDYKDVDLTVGGSMETLVPGSQVGPTFLCILNQQFLRTRMADRFFYEHPQSGFTAEQLAEIRKASISSMFCLSGDGITNIQPLGFVLIKSFNPVTDCKNITKMDLTHWKEK